MLAQRFAGLLPPMTVEDALQSAALASLAGRFKLERWATRPTCAPHHTASAVALVGGGSPPRPGEISLAHHGVLFLDELPEFPRPALEALREPLETGVITISRAARRAEFPAQFQLIAAMNPCPCGYLGHPTRACRCTPDQVSRYQGRISGPLLDRIDLQVVVSPVDAQDLLQPAMSEPSAKVRERVLTAREIQLKRQLKPNQGLAAGEILEQAQVEEAAEKLLRQAMQKLGWSARSFHRVLRVARTIADLEPAPRVQVGHVAEAIQFRRGLGGTSAS